MAANNERDHSLYPQRYTIERLTLPEAMGIGSTSETPVVALDTAGISALVTGAPENTIGRPPLPGESAKAYTDRLVAGDINPDRDEPAYRYTLGGSDEAGWAIVDLRTGRALARMQLDGSTYAELYATEAEARKALVYVREHGELPDGEESFEDYLEHADEFGAWDADKAETQEPIAAEPLPARAAWHVVVLDGLSPGGAARAAALQTDLRRLADLVPAIVEAEEVRARLAAAGVSLTGF